MTPEEPGKTSYASLEKELAEKSITLNRKIRELEIEAAFEKVRDRAMAMRSSAELAETSSVLFQQLSALGINSIRAGVGIFDDINGAMEIWLTTRSNSQEVVKILDYVNLHVHPVFENIIPARQAHKPFALTVLSGDEVKGYYQTMSTYTAFQQLAFNNREYFYSFFFSQGTINLIAMQELTEEECSIMIRLAKVFGLIYTRFIDLQTAEGQAREANIDAVLEKVRGRTMAMNNATELFEVANNIFAELWRIVTKPIQYGVSLLAKDDPKCLVYNGSEEDSSETINRIGIVMLNEQEILTSMYDHWLRQEDFFPVLNGESLYAFYSLVMPGIDRTTPEFDSEQYAFFLPFSKGSFFGWYGMPFADSEVNILKRFATQIDLAFCRHLELLQSEANAHELLRQASLNRIRGQIASMRTARDLQEITPLIWKELNILGIPFIRCGVFIMDEDQQVVRTFLSAANAQAIAVLNFPYGTAGLPQHALDNWRRQSVHREHWTAADFTNFWTTICATHPHLAEPMHQRQNPPEQLYLHLLPFLQGMLYVGNTEPLGDTDMQLLQSVAETFSTAYARYDDFRQLEDAKAHIEDTLTELKATQSQLIQSEKMASLGEMTAGIAHEIQNPLNFVNNFSEVNAELIAEMQAAIQLGNLEDVKAIATDIAANEEKICHHGRRADVIVKSMLQHSRSSSNTKELTDINILADEYIRLCYHGLRAKDKSFNATIKTDFDTSIGKINIIPQDIGRVVLNLVTNAFYAVNKRKQNGTEGYEPTVTLSTKKTGDMVEIRVTDNGGGIPAKVLDKIFQPFFTTKPTGEGTGLGLSLSYDIINAHNGSVQVETEEGKGSVFIIQLPCL